MSFAWRQNPVRSVRIYIENPGIESGETALLGQAAKHVVRVLRMKPGQSLVLFDGTGREYPATIVASTLDKVDLKVGSEARVNRESRLGTTLAVALARGERMDLIVQKATELGVNEIVPITSARTVVRLGPERAAKRRQHWRRVTISACEQCGRNRLPEIKPLVGLADWLQQLPDKDSDELRFVADPNDGRTLETQNKTVRSLKLLTGPEGGFTKAEACLAVEQGFASILIGPRILRAETAAIAMLAAMQWQYGDLRSF